MPFTQIQRSVALLLGNDSAVSLSKIRKDKLVSKSIESPNMDAPKLTMVHPDCVGSRVGCSKDEEHKDYSTSQTFKEFVQCSAIM